MFWIMKLQQRGFIGYFRFSYIESKVLSLEGSNSLGNCPSPHWFLWRFLFLSPGSFKKTHRLALLWFPMNRRQRNLKDQDPLQDPVWQWNSRQTTNLWSVSLSKKGLALALWDGLSHKGLKKRRKWKHHPNSTSHRLPCWVSPTIVLRQHRYVSLQTLAILSSLAKQGWICFSCLKVCLLKTISGPGWNGKTTRVLFVVLSSVRTWTIYRCIGFRVARDASHPQEANCCALSKMADNPYRTKETPWVTAIDVQSSTNTITALQCLSASL